MKILFISSPHPSNAIEAPAKLILEGFKKIGYHADHVNASKELNRKELINLLEKNDYDFVFTLNIRTLLLRKHINRIFKIIKCPIIVFLLDHPVYHMDGIRKILPNVKQSICLLTPDEIHQRILSEYIQKNKYTYASAVFFPWAAPIDLPNKNHNIQIYDLLCFCSLDGEIESGTSEKEFIDSLNEKSEKIYFEEFFNQIVNIDLSTPLEIHFEKGFKKKLDFDSPELCERFAQFDSLVKRIRRNLFGKMILSTATKSNLKLCLCGSGWDKITNIHDNVTLLGSVSYMEQFALYAQTKILINIDPNWTNGIHDRVFNSLASGISVITNKSHYLLTDPIPENKIIFFQYLNELPERIEYLVNHTTVCDQISLPSDTWFSRAKYLLQTFLSQK